MLVLDTSVLLAAIDINEPDHHRVVACLDDEREALVVPDFVVVETEYLLQKRVGSAAAEAFVDDLLSGALKREPVTDADLSRALSVLRRFDGLGSITDAVILAIAERLNTRRVATLDLRHFRRLKFKDKQPLTLLPADARLAAGRK